MRIRVPLAVAVTAAVVIGGCGEKPEGAAEDSLGRARDTNTTISRDLPAGRFELPTTNSPAPNLWLTLPPGYSVKTAETNPDDLFFIVASDDPSGRDTTQITPGFMRVYVGPTAQRPFGDLKVSEWERVFVAGRPLQWRVADEALPDGRRYLKRELRSSDFFAALSPELARVPLQLHIYIAGGDSVRVAALTTAAESISIVP